MLSKDDVLKITRQAGFMLVTDSQEGQSDWYECFTEEIEAFAKMVDANATEREREACAKVCEARAEEEFGMAYEGIALDCAAAIRARGETTLRGETT